MRLGMLVKRKISVFLGVFAKLRKATISFKSVRLSAWHYFAPTRRIFMKFDILLFFEKLSRHF